MQDPARVIRETDADAVRLGKTLVRSARFGALATLDHTNGFPTVSRVGVATDLDGTPVILVSMLAAHTKALLGDARCSLLLGEPGKGDALAYPRISLWCNAERVEATGADAARVRRRYLNRNPKASLYAGLGDFHFFRLCIRSASLNGGFGRAYQLAGGELSAPCLAGLAEIEQSAIDKMNADHPEAIRLCAVHFSKLEPLEWRICGIDAEGLDVACGDRFGRIDYPTQLEEVQQLQPHLAEMAQAARDGH